METFTLLGTGGQPHASNNEVTFQASINDELTLPVCNDSKVGLHIVDLYINNEIVALINFSCESYLGKTAIYYNYGNGKMYSFVIQEEKVILE